MTGSKAAVSIFQPKPDMMTSTKATTEKIILYYKHGLLPISSKKTRTTRKVSSPPKVTLSSGVVKLTVAMMKTRPLTTVVVNATKTPLLNFSQSTKLLSLSSKFILRIIGVARQ